VPGEPKDVPPAPACLICGRPPVGGPLGTSAFSPRTGRRPGEVQSRLWECPACRLIFRDSDYTVGDASASLDQAPYVLPENEDLIMQGKRGVFAHLARTLSARFDPAARGRTVVDFGCSYGHLGKSFQAAGWKVYGVDRASGILRYHRERGSFPVVADLDSPEIPDGGVDAVTMIDVICYLEKPIDVLRVAHRKLARPGVVVLRVPNRNRLLKLAAAIQRLGGGDPLRRFEVDHKSYWTVRAIKAAAAAAGFDRVRIRRREHGYWYPWRRKALHWSTQMLSHVTGGWVDFATVFYAELWKDPPPGGGTVTRGTP
jgi:SAM-dependent methyltransferase